MADIVRRRKPSPVEFALTPSLGEVSRAHLQEVHDNLGNLAARIQAVKDSVPAEPEFPDYSSEFDWLRAMIRDLEDKIEELEKEETTQEYLRIFVVPNFADLPDVNPPAAGLTTDAPDEDQYFVRIGTAASGSWISFSHLRA